MASGAVEAARTLVERYYSAIAAHDVAAMLDCVSEDVSVTFPDSGRDWQGRASAEVKFAGWFQSQPDVLVRDLTITACFECAEGREVAVELSCDFGSGLRSMGYRVRDGAIAVISHL
mmetsp:Transcript_62804/g.187262  ORF Transcript_62804/g.187262 Transcript_62804/m.187262 type:complete len:117 (+) Transcript_62804:90-440(+)